MYLYLPLILFLRLFVLYLFLICILLLHLLLVLFLYFHVQTFQIWFVGACCSAGSTMPLDSSSNTSLLSNTTIDTNTNIVINCIFIIICACLRICIYIYQYCICNQQAANLLQSPIILNKTLSPQRATVQWGNKQTLALAVIYHCHRGHKASKNRLTFSNLELTKDHVLQVLML